MPGRGLLISMEGGENSGKTTQTALLRDYLLSHGLDVLVVREPGGTKLGEALREILLDPGHADMTPEAEALLYAAARSQLTHSVIWPALERGTLVISDRYIDSSLAYQGYGLDLGVDKIRDLNLWVTGGLMPDLTVFFDVEVPKQSDIADRIERRDDPYHRKVRQGYRCLADREPDRFFVVDNCLSVEGVHDLVVSAVEDLLDRSK